MEFKIETLFGVGELLHEKIKNRERTIKESRSLFSRYVKLSRSLFNQELYASLLGTGVKNIAENDPEIIESNCISLDYKLYLNSPSCVWRLKINK